MKWIDECLACYVVDSYIFTIIFYPGDSYIALNEELSKVDWIEK